MSGSWQARKIASTSSGRCGRRTSRSVRTTSVVRSTAERSRLTGPSSGVAEDPVHRDLEDDARGVLPWLLVPAGVALHGIGDGVGVVAHYRRPLEGCPAPAV